MNEIWTEVVVKKSDFALGMYEFYNPETRRLEHCPDLAIITELFPHFIIKMI